MHVRMYIYAHGLQHLQPACRFYYYKPCCVYILDTHSHVYIIDTHSHVCMYKMIIVRNCVNFCIYWDQESISCDEGFYLHSIWLFELSSVNIKNFMTHKKINRKRPASVHIQNCNSFENDCSTQTDQASFQGFFAFENAHPIQNAFF